MNNKIININNISFYTEYFGDIKNSAILLISGAMGSARFWPNAFCKKLAAAGYFVIRYDHRDSGLSDAINYNHSPYNINDLAQDAINILDGYQIKKAHIIGHSLGGAIAKICAINYPERALSLTCISSGLISDQPLNNQEKEILDKTWQRMLKNNPQENYEKSVDGFLQTYKYLNGSVKFDEQMAKDYIKDLYERSKHVSWFLKFAETKEMHNHVKAQQNMPDYKNLLKNINVPVTIIHGQLDPLCFVRPIIEETKYIKHAKIYIIPEMGHMIFNKKLFSEISNIIL